MQKLQPQQIIGIGRFLTSKETSIWPKIGLILAVTYLLFPVDLIPDAIPVLGVMDDIGIGTLALWWLSSATRQFNVKQIEERKKD